MANRRIRELLSLTCLGLALVLPLAAPSADGPKWPARASKPAASKPPAVEAPAANPLASVQYFGSAAGEDGRVVYFLTDGGQLLSVAQGDLIRSDYRVEGVAEDDSLTLTQVKTQQKIQLTPHVSNDPVARTMPAAPPSDDAAAVQRARRRARDD
jgi:hypothetical protein